MNWQDILKEYNVQRTGECPKCGEYVDAISGDKCPENSFNCPMMKPRPNPLKEYSSI